MIIKKIADVIERTSNFSQIREEKEWPTIYNDLDLNEMMSQYKL